MARLDQRQARCISCVLSQRLRVYFFLTLRTNNLPESGKRQYQNKGTYAPTDVIASIGEKHDEEKFALQFFPPNEMPALFSSAAQHRNPTQAA
jgi:hypothetical protein